MAIQTGKSLKDEKRLKHDVDSYYMKSPTEMDARVQGRPRGDREHREDRRRSATSSSSSTRPYPAEVQGPRRRDARHVHRASSSTRASSAGSASSPSAASKFDPRRSIASAARSSSTSSRRWGSRATSSSSGTSSTGRRSTASRSARAAARAPARSSRTRCASPTSIRIPYKLLFERFLNPERVSMPDFDVDFCMDRRDEVIEYVQREVRQGPASGRSPRSTSSRRAASSATSRARWRFRSPRPTSSRSSCPSRSQGKSPPVREAIEQKPELKQLYDESPLHRELLDLAAVARGPHPPRRHARRRRRHRRGAALGVRAVLPRPERRDRHPVRDGRRREGRPRQVRLPRPEDAHRDRDRGAARSTSSAPRAGEDDVRHRPHPARTTPTSTR